MRKSRIPVLALVAISSLLVTQQALPAKAATSPTFFVYQLTDGVIINNAVKTYVPLGKSYGIRYRVDNTGASGPGSLIFRMYSDGTLLWTQTAKVTSNGVFTRKISAHVFKAGTKNYGPFYLCVTEVLASGKKEDKAPCSKWMWVPIEVPIAYVSNGCGGMTPINWVNKKEIEMLDTRDLGGGIIISFRNACNFHDAGYKGLTVKNPSTGKVESTRHWTRKIVDDRFKQEILMACANLAKLGLKDSKILMALPTALPACNVWAERYYFAVRTVGHLFFDADPTMPGSQGIYTPISGHPSNVGRDIT
jgi:hypothetical protein